MIMKKKLTALFLTLVMCMTVCAPAFAADTGNSDEFVPELAEGETWHPANGIMPLEDDYPCNHRAPSGYFYQGYIEGNTLLEAVFKTSALTLSTMLVPQLGVVNIVISTASTIETIRNWVEDGMLRSTYHRYIYKKGTDYWYHTYWYYRGDDGYLHYLTCEVDI